MKILQECIWSRYMTLTFDLWPWTLFQQCTLTCCANPSTKYRDTASRGATCRC